MLRVSVQPVQQASVRPLESERLRVQQALLLLALRVSQPVRVPLRELGWQVLRRVGPALEPVRQRLPLSSSGSISGERRPNSVVHLPSK